MSRLLFTIGHEDSPWHPKGSKSLTGARKVAKNVILTSCARREAEARKAGLSKGPGGCILFSPVHFIKIKLYGVIHPGTCQTETCLALTV